MVNLSCARVGSVLAQVPQALKQSCIKVSQAIARVFKNAFAAIACFFERFKSSTPAPMRTPTPIPTPKPPGPPPAPPATIPRDLVCAICKDYPTAQAMNLDPRKGPVNAELLQCAHKFHTACLNLWLPINNACPECRVPNPRPGPPPAPPATIPRDLVCVICEEDADPKAAMNLDPRKGPVNAELLRCAHKFHTACLNLWLPHSNTCPECRLPNPRIVA